jgi:GT2 family glycosyltransferase
VRDKIMAEIPDVEVLPSGSPQGRCRSGFEESARQAGDRAKRGTVSGAPGPAEETVLVGPGAPDEVPHLPAVTPETLRDACGFRPTAPTDLASIVILTRNQLWCTELCLYAIEWATREPYEVVVVDNGSTDGTREFLRDWAETRPHLTLVFNAGFALGCNQGIAAARGEHIVLLNNDVVVTDGWLGRLLRPLRNPEVGIVGPRTNCVAGSQRVEDVAYNQRTVEDLDPFARSWARRHAGKARLDDVAIGFCMAIRGEVLRTIGGLDPRFGTGNFEDDDYCLRAQIAGYHVVIAEDCFVHHFGSQTFQGETKKSSLDYTDLMQRNRKIFMDKWGVWLDAEGKPQLGSMLGHFVQMGRRFNIEELRVGLPPEGELRVAAVPAPVGGLKETSLLVWPDWEDAAWERVVADFAREFDASSPVALVLPRPPRAALDRLGALLSAADAPDVLVMDAPFSLADLVATCQGVVPCGDAFDPVVVHAAKLLGKVVIPGGLDRDSLLRGTGLHGAVRPVHP